MIDVEPLLVSELERMVPLPAADRLDWNDVVQRSKPVRQRMRLVFAAAAVTALIIVGAAYAAGFGPFAGIGAADRPPSSADVLDPAIVSEIQTINARGFAQGQLLPDSARLVAQVASGQRIYVVGTSTGELCVLIEEHPGTSNASAIGCGNPLSQSQPTTDETIRPNEETPPLSFGVARDGVVAVSFMAGGSEQTVPVRNNVWVYEGASSALESVTVHYADGSTQLITHG